MADLLTWEALALQLINPFRLSYGASSTRRVFVITLKDHEGCGEAAIPPYYGVREEDMVAVWQAAAARQKPLPETPQEIEGWVGAEGPAAARTALELALYDRLALHRGLPLYRLLELPRPEPQPTSFTIAIDSVEEMARQALRVAKYPVLKIKLGSQDDLARLRAIRAARPEAHLRVDANASWTRQEAARLISQLEPLGLELLEQPLPKEDLEGLGWLQKQTSLPVLADESLQTLEDVERLADAGVAGINLKLMKAGGLTPALRIARRAVERGMRVMLGCMIETSLGATAMAHLASLAEWLDLDSPMLISNDPFKGLWYDEKATLHLPDRPGIGAVRIQPTRS